MKVLTDHCVPESVVAALRDGGIDVSRVVDCMDPAAPDKNVAEAARRMQAVLLTADGDFQRRRDFQPRHYAGIILLKDLHAAREAVLRRLDRLLARRSEAEFAGTLTILDRRSCRTRR